MNMNTVKKEKYVVDLKRLQTICSRNYALLLRLLPLEYIQGQQWHIELGQGLYFELSVSDISPYTEQFTLQQRSTLSTLVGQMDIEFRLYHDAQMVEVTKYQQQDRIRPNNPYPNDKLHHKDEKTQINALLKDWLNLAIDHQPDKIDDRLLKNSASS